MRRNFTLSETVVVIAIVTVGVALAAPVLQLRLDRARLTSCENRLRALGMANALYMQDFQAVVPCGEWPASKESRLWTQLLGPYLGMEQEMTEGQFNAETVIPCYQCPQDPEPFQEDEAPASFGKQGLSYAENRRVASASTAKVKIPSQTFLFLDSQGTHVVDETSRAHARFDHGVGVLFGMNVLRLDGSVVTFVEENAHEAFVEKNFAFESSGITAK